MRMEANAGLVAGSHNRNELVVIRPDSEGVSPNLDFPSIFGPSCGRLAALLVFSDRHYLSKLMCYLNAETPLLLF